MEESKESNAPKVISVKGTLEDLRNMTIELFKEMDELKEYNALKDQELYKLREEIKFFNEREAQYEGIFIEIPVELRTPIQQYLTFFQDYVRIAKNENIEFHINKTDNGLKVNTKITEEVEKEKMQAWLDEYMGFIKTNVENITINVEGSPNTKDVDLLRVKLENEISHLNNSVKIAQLENHLLKEYNEHLKLLTLKFADKDTVINNQYIINNSSQLSETDRKFIQLIHDNTDNEEERAALIESLQTVKSDDASETEKKKSGGMLKKFLESGVTEAGKHIVKEIFEYGGKYLEYLT